MDELSNVQLNINDILEQLGAEIARLNIEQAKQSAYIESLLKMVNEKEVKDAKDNK